MAGRNLAAGQARGRYLLMVDDDSCSLPGAVERMIGVLESGRIGVVGGLVRNIGRDGDVLVDHQVGSFASWLRAGRTGAPPPAGWPAFFLPEGAALFRRDAYTEVCGFFEPGSFASCEVDLATRLVTSSMSSAARTTS